MIERQEAEYKTSEIESREHTGIPLTNDVPSVCIHPFSLGLSLAHVYIFKNTLVSHLDLEAEGMLLLFQNTTTNLTPCLATRAYRQAMSTLATLTAHPPAHTFDPSLAVTPNTKSLLSSLLPSIQGQGPIGSALRIAVKLHQYTLRRLTSSKERAGLNTSKRKDDEWRDKSIKVVDLLEHSAELGNMDALYTLAYISLVSSPTLLLYTIIQLRLSFLLRVFSPSIQPPLSTASWPTQKRQEMQHHSPTLPSSTAPATARLRP